MKWRRLYCAIAVLTVAGLAARPESLWENRQAVADTAETHVERARLAAGTDWTTLFGLCNPPKPSPAIQNDQASPTPSGPPPRSEWYAEPAKVFDNLYFLGDKEDYSAWAVTTSAGIILIDALWDYSVEDQVAGGLKKLGFDPATLKYVVVSHGHADHAGGARFLQERFGARVIMSDPEWNTLAKNSEPWPKPTRDLVASDGQKLTLGDTTLTLHVTPGHTPGTISTLIPVRDGGKPHLVAAWGGTAFNFTISPGKDARYWFQTYSQSAQRFRDVVTKAGADALIANHHSLDQSQRKLAALANRKPGTPHPYVVGNDAVRRYLTVADECAKANLIRLGSSSGV
jgi:metallo-beta-lactamase class B